jgi:hypothetical protein
MKLDKFLDKLKKDLSKTKLGEIASKSLYKEDSAIVQLLQKHSPRDSGKYASNWRAKRLRFGDASQLAGLVITNETPIYGQFMEEGAEPGQAPWYFPHRIRKGKKGAGRFKKGTGKLKLTPGRVWAGGLNPGHELTVGGAINIVLKEKDLWQKLTLEISDAIVKGILK